MCVYILNCHRVEDMTNLISPYSIPMLRKGGFVDIDRLVPLSTFLTLTNSTG